MGKPPAYVRGKPGSTIYVMHRDAEFLRRYGWVAMPDMEAVPSECAVYEIDQDKLTSRLVGLARKPPGVRRVARALQSRYTQTNTGWRVHDVADIAKLAERTGRAKRSIIRWIDKVPNFPQPVMKVGYSRVWRLWEVTAWLQDRGMPVMWKKPKGGGDEQEERDES